MVLLWHTYQELATTMTPGLGPAMVHVVNNSTNANTTTQPFQNVSMYDQQDYDTTTTTTTTTTHHHLRHPQDRNESRDDSWAHTFRLAESTSYRLWRTIATWPLVSLFGIFTLLCAWTLTSLLLYHMMIISVAQTTNERVRGVYRYTGAGGGTNAAAAATYNNATTNATGNHHNSTTSNNAVLVNPADKGCLGNWNQAFCSPIPPTRLPYDFSQMVVADGTPETPWGGGETAASSGNLIRSHDSVASSSQPP